MSECRVGADLQVQQPVLSSVLLEHLVQPIAVVEHVSAVRHHVVRLLGISRLDCAFEVGQHRIHVGIGFEVEFLLAADGPGQVLEPGAAQQDGDHFALALHKNPAVLFHYIILTGKPQQSGL
jgi:hypothetical protein